MPSYCPFGLEPAICEIQGGRKSEMHGMTQIWPWTCTRYILKLLLTKRQNGKSKKIYSFNEIWWIGTFSQKIGVTLLDGFQETGFTYSHDRQPTDWRPMTDAHTMKIGLLCSRTFRNHSIEYFHECIHSVMRTFSIWIQRSVQSGRPCRTKHRFMWRSRSSQSKS